MAFNPLFPFSAAEDHRDNYHPLGITGFPGTVTHPFSGSLIYYPIDDDHYVQIGIRLGVTPGSGTEHNDLMPRQPFLKKISKSVQNLLFDSLHRHGFPLNGFPDFL